jgi:hypothetical protein
MLLKAKGELGCADSFARVTKHLLITDSRRFHKVLNCKAAPKVITIFKFENFIFNPRILCNKEVILRFGP